MAGSAMRFVGVLLAGVLMTGCGAAQGPSSPTLATPTPSATAAPSATGITRDQAIAEARAAVPRYASADVLSASVGRFADSVTEYTAAHFTPPPAPDRLVWRVTLGYSAPPTGGQGTDVIIDYWTGAFILATDWIS